MGLKSPVVVIAVVSAAVVAAIIDVRRFKVPNWLTIPLLMAGIGYHGVVAGVDGVQSSLLGAVLGFGILFPMYLMGGMGAGDVKFVTAVGAWLGVPTVLYVFVVAALATGLYSTVVVVGEGGVKRLAVVVQLATVRFLTIWKHLGQEERVESIAERPDRRKRLVPFGA